MPGSVLPADTFGYMVLGYAVILGTIALYGLSLVVRVRRRLRELDVLEERGRRE